MFPINMEQNIAFFSCLHFLFFYREFKHKLGPSSHNDTAVAAPNFCDLTKVIAMNFWSRLVHTPSGCTAATPYNE